MLYAVRLNLRHLSNLAIWQARLSPMIRKDKSELMSKAEDNGTG
jgi:hypothetical protein